MSLRRLAMAPSPSLCALLFAFPIDTIGDWVLPFSQFVWLVSMSSSLAILIESIIHSLLWHCLSLFFLFSCVSILNSHSEQHPHFCVVLCTLKLQLAKFRGTVLRLLLEMSPLGSPDTLLSTIRQEKRGRASWQLTELPSFQSGSWLSLWMSQSNNRL